MQDRINTLLKLLEENHWDVFSIDMLADSCEMSRRDIHGAVRYLTQKGTVVAIERGKYRRRYYTDEYVIACSMVKDGGIAYWSALNSHGLTEQFPNKIFIQSSRRGVEKKIEGLGAVLHFVNAKHQKITGYKNFGYGNHTYRMTDVDKTIVDCFDLPLYSGGYPEIIKAFNKAKLNAHKMVKYCKAVDNNAATKRLAYLSELLNKPNMEHFLKYARESLNEHYTPFISDLAVKGKYLKKWMLVLNLEENEILEIANPGL